MKLLSASSMSGRGALGSEFGVKVIQLPKPQQYVK